MKTEAQLISKLAKIRNDWEAAFAESITYTDNKIRREAAEHAMACNEHAYAVTLEGLR